MKIIPLLSAGLALLAATTATAGPQPFGHVAPVPEPATWMMMLSGLGVIGAALRRRTRALLSGKI